MPIFAHEENPLSDQEWENIKNVVINVARMPDGKTGSHVLAYADKAGATEENALFGTPEEIAGMIDALRDAGVTYVLLTIAGGVDQLRRFAREIMPAFARESAARAVGIAVANEEVAAFFRDRYPGLDVLVVPWEPCEV